MDVYLTFGIDDSGEWQTINEVKSGMTKLHCPWCKQTLIAKKGKIKTHHFAHNGETCRTSQDAIAQTQLPTFDTFTLLNSHETKYLERRARYGSHDRVYSWNGMSEAVKNLEVMEILKVERTTEPREPNLKKVIADLKKLDGGWLDDDDKPTPKLLALFSALKPIVDLEKKLSDCTTMTATTIDRNYRKNQLDKLKTLAELDEAQRYWFDSFFRKQTATAPEYVDFLTQRLNALNRQNLYIMRFTGDFNDNLPCEFIKIGISTRNSGLRLKEVIANLKPFGNNVKGEILAVKKNAGRLERLLHHCLLEDNLKVGTFIEFFNTKKLSWLLSEINETPVIAYTPPVPSTSDTPIQKTTANTSYNPQKKGGRSKKTDSELIAEYSDITELLNQNKGIREIGRLLKRSVNTVQKVKNALANQQNHRSGQ